MLWHAVSQHPGAPAAPSARSRQLLDARILVARQSDGWIRGGGPPRSHRFPPEWCRCREDHLPDRAEQQPCGGQVTHDVSGQSSLFTPPPTRPAGRLTSPPAVVDPNRRGRSCSSDAQPARRNKRIPCFMCRRPSHDGQLTGPTVSREPQAPWFPRPCDAHTRSPARWRGSEGAGQTPTPAHPPASVMTARRPASTRVRECVHDTQMRVCVAVPENGGPRESSAIGLGFVTTTTVLSWPSPRCPRIVTPHPGSLGYP
jgi:hypothetical protein